MSGDELGGRLTEYIAPPWRWCVLETDGAVFTHFGLAGMLA